MLKIITIFCCLISIAKFQTLFHQLESPIPIGNRRYIPHVRAAAPRTMLLEWKPYIRQVAQEFIYELEDFGLCNVFLSDFNNTVSRHYFGFEAKGTVHYTNGFLGTMQSATIKNMSEQSNLLEAENISKIWLKLIFNDLMFYYDYRANLTATGEFSGTVAIPLLNVEMDLTVTHSYTTNNTKGLLEVKGTAIPKLSTWLYEPSNEYTQLIVREKNLDIFEEMKIIANTTFNNLLNIVINRLDYPKICFDCNSKTDNYY